MDYPSIHSLMHTMKQDGQGGRGGRASDGSNQGGYGVAGRSTSTSLLCIRLGTCAYKGGASKGGASVGAPFTCFEKFPFLARFALPASSSLLCTYEHSPLTSNQIDCNRSTDPSSTYSVSVKQSCALVQMCSVQHSSVASLLYCKWYRAPAVSTPGKA